MADVRDLTGQCTSVVLRLTKVGEGKYNVHAELQDDQQDLVDRVQVAERRTLPFAMELLVGASLSVERLINQAKIKVNEDT